MPLDSRDVKRKLVHAGMGLFALLLRWLDWKAAAALAAVALLFNLFVMPRIGRGIYRDESKARDPGIVAYPAMVLALILLFRHELGAAAALWGMMAFGDPAASIVGKRLGGPRLPWNRKKTAAGFLAYAVVGTIAAGALWTWVWTGTAQRFASHPFAAVLEASILFLPVTTLGALLESLDTGLDDNWVPPLPCAAMMAWLMAGGYGYWGHLAVAWPVALAVNGGVALAMLAARAVAPSGAAAGAGLGFVILAAAGWPAYAVLWTFFVVATAATKLGYARKERAGTAQAEKGRRGARHAIANCAVGAALAIVALAISANAAHRQTILLAFTGAFAAALADTLGTELGSLYGKRPISLLARRAVPPGTSGAVSGAGLAGGLAGGALVGAVAALAGLIPWSAAWIGAAAGIAGSLAESLIGDSARLRGGRIEHDFANAFNTFVGASVAAEIAASLELGRLYVPFEI
jgi:uncharacterized protein (TIGR00297 family)